MSIPAWSLVLAALRQVGSRPGGPQISFTATLGVRETSSQSTAHQKRLFKAKPDLPGMEWMPGLAGREHVPSLRTGPQPPLPCPPPCQGEGSHLLFNRKNHLNLVF